MIGYLAFDSIEWSTIQHHLNVHPFYLTEILVLSMNHHKHQGLLYILQNETTVMKYM